MNFSTIVYGALIGYAGYKLGEKVQKVRQERDEEDFGVLDLVEEFFDELCNDDSILRDKKRLKDIVQD